MKIYNATKSSLDLPYGMHRLKIEPNSFSQDFMGTIEFIKTLVSSYGSDEVAILVGGPYELSMCANIPVAVSYVAQTTDEIIQKFHLNPTTSTNKKEEEKSEPDNKVVVEKETGEDAVYVGEEPAPTPEPAPAPKKKKTTKKKTSE